MHSKYETRAIFLSRVRLRPNWGSRLASLCSVTFPDISTVRTEEEGRRRNEDELKSGEFPSPIVLVLVLVFPALFRLPPFKIEDEHDNEDDRRMTAQERKPKGQAVGDPMVQPEIARRKNAGFW
jgi:hypothetical protein